MSMINGKSILAMASDYTSVKEMLQLMGVEPTEEIISEATQSFALKGNELTMDGLYDFLKQKSVMSKLKKPLKRVRIADVRDIDKKSSQVKDLR